MPRHSSYALFRLNSSLSFSSRKLCFFAMSFANNCFGLCNTCLHCFHRRSFLRQRIVVSHKYIGKTFLSKNLSQYNYLFRFCFLYSVFNDHLPALMGLAVASFKQLRLRSRHRILCESPPEFGRRNLRLVGSSNLDHRHNCLCARIFYCFRHLRITP